MTEETIQIKVECAKCGEPYVVGACYFDNEGIPVFMLEPHNCGTPKEG